MPALSWVRDTYSALATGERRSDVTMYLLDSGRPGPEVVVLGGVHGDEVGGIVAASRLTQSSLSLLCGRLLVVPIAHQAAFEANSRESPIDGANLAREFPGRIAGTPTQALARLLTDRLLTRCDMLIDLHTSSPHTDMPFFAGCLDDGSPLSMRSFELAKTFGAPVVWTHSTLGPGRTLGVAADRGIPAIYVESPNGGVLDQSTVEAYVAGVFRVLAAMEMIRPLESPGLENKDQILVHGDGDVDMFAPAPVDGLFIRTVRLLDYVDRGDLVGCMLDSNGRPLRDIASPAQGRVVTLRRQAATPAGTPLIGIAPQRSSPGDHRSHISFPTTGAGPVRSDSRQR